MQLDVQWFISALVDNELISLADAVSLGDRLGGDPDLATYAQAVCDSLAETVPPESLDALVGQMEQVIAFAQEQAAGGEAPDFFASPQPESVPESPLVFDKDAPPPPSVRADDAGPARTIHGPRVTKRPVLKKESAAQEDAFSTAEPVMEFEATELGLPSLRNIDSMNDEQLAELMKTLLLSLRDFGASDLHISANSMPFIRRNLRIERIEECVISPEAAERLNFALLSEKRKAQFQKELDMNFALEIGKSRFRAALMYQKDGVSGSYRLVPGEVLSLQELGFLEHDAATLERLMDYHNGLVLVTGPVGSGKTTTLAALVDIANRKRRDHIITVEDPIEILQESNLCQVTQREVGRHTESYSRALKGALREDPDIIVIGEMHDLETIENAITASETGHLVIGTLHTCDAANTMNRILDVFPPNQQPQIRAMTAGSLRGIICQRLIPAADGGLTVAYEILVNTLAVGNIISEGKVFQLKATMQIGSKAGMCTLDQNLLAKFKAGIITYETALEYMTDPMEIAALNREKAILEAQKLAANLPQDSTR